MRAITSCYPKYSSAHSSSVAAQCQPSSLVITTTNKKKIIKIQKNIIKIFFINLASLFLDSKNQLYFPLLLPLSSSKCSEVIGMLSCRSNFFIFDCVIVDFFVGIFPPLFDFANLNIVFFDMI